MALNPTKAFNDELRSDISIGRVEVRFMLVDCGSSDSAQRMYFKMDDIWQPDAILVVAGCRGTAKKMEHIRHLETA